MKKYTHLLFDLDGTIINPAEGITKCVAYALSYFGVEVADLKTLYPFIGPPLVDSFIELYNFSDEQANTALAKYRERFATVGIFENALYPGIIPFLQRANQSGFKLYLATSKPTVFAKQILERFGLSHEFLFVGGSELDGARNAKADVIRYVLQESKIVNLNQTVMIGDRKHDIIGAKTTGLDSVGVLYGFGSREELLSSGASYIVENVEGLSKFFALS
jgi:phosphoglycolate phosphatase